MYLAPKLSDFHCVIYRRMYCLLDLIRAAGLTFCTRKIRVCFQRSTQNGRFRRERKSELIAAKFALGPLNANADTLNFIVLDITDIIITRISDAC